MKKALIYAGPYRASKEIMMNHMKLFDDSYDIFVSCFEHYLNDWKSSGWNVKEYFVTPPIDITQTNWFKYRNDSAGQSGFWQFWNLKSVIDNIIDDYDFFIKNRNDIIFDTTKSINIELKPNTIFSAEKSFHKNEWDSNNWINDEFYIGDSNVMKVISKFATDYYKIDNRHYVNEPIASNESQLRNHLRENNINVEKIKNIEYRKNFNGVTCPSGYVGFQLENI